jgi:hypothetical protein
LFDGETLALRKVDQKYLENFEMWRWRRMEKISWTDCIRNEGLLHRVKERIVLRAIKIVNAIELVTPCIGTTF